MKTRMYAVSMKAILPFKKVDASLPDTARIEHSARIIIAHTIQEAKEKAEPLVFDMWPRSDRWERHTMVVVAPVALELNDAVQETVIERSLSFVDDLGEGSQLFEL